MSDILEKTFYMGLGALTITKEVAEKWIDELIEKGKVSREKGSQMVKDLVTKAEKEKKILDDKIHRSIESTIKKLNLPTRQELEEINKKIDHLQKELQKRK